MLEEDITKFREYWNGMLKKYGYYLEKESAEYEFVFGEDDEEVNIVNIFKETIPDEVIAFKIIRNISLLYLIKEELKEEVDDNYEFTFEQKIDFNISIIKENVDYKKTKGFNVKNTTELYSVIDKSFNLLLTIMNKINDYTDNEFSFTSQLRKFIKNKDYEKGYDKAAYDFLINNEEYYKMYINKKDSAMKNRRMIDTKKYIEETDDNYYSNNKSIAIICSFIGTFFSPVIFQLIAICNWNSCIKKCKTERETNPYVFGLGYSYFIMFCKIAYSLAKSNGTNGNAELFLGIVFAVTVALIHCAILRDSDEYKNNKIDLKNNAEDSEKKINNKEKFKSIECSFDESKHHNYKDKLKQENNKNTKLDDYSLELEYLMIEFSAKDISERQKKTVHNLLKANRIKYILATKMYCCVHGEMDKSQEESMIKLLDERLKSMNENKELKNMKYGEELFLALENINDDIYETIDEDLLNLYRTNSKNLITRVLISEEINFDIAQDAVTSLLAYFEYLERLFSIMMLYCMALYCFDYEVFKKGDFGSIYEELDSKKIKNKKSFIDVVKFDDIYLSYVKCLNLIMSEENND